MLKRLYVDLLTIYIKINWKRVIQVLYVIRKIIINIMVLQCGHETRLLLLWTKLGVLVLPLEEEELKYTNFNKYCKNMTYSHNIKCKKHTGEGFLESQISKTHLEP